ncbi:MAG: serine/threonine protein kinase [Oscillochloridaceae bacterium umkhey_bin13]
MLAPDTLVQDRYKIVAAIGKGGMGAVYQAIDLRLRSTVALKETLVSGEIAERAFTREAQLLAGLRHPALPKVSDHFADQQGHFLVMEFIPGEDLASMLAQRGAPFGLDEVLPWADQLLDVLEYLHSRQPPVIHRDLKPQNLKLTERGQIILLDFGLAKGAVGQTRVTSSTSVFGYTPHYAPLEQIQGVGTDPRSDLYSLAATLYHLLSNEAPADALSRAAARIDERPDPLTALHTINPSIPEPISAVLMRALSQRADLRPANATAMRTELRDAVLGVGPISSSSGMATMLSDPGNVVKVAPKTNPPVQVAPQQGVTALPVAPETQVFTSPTTTPLRQGPPVWLWFAGMVVLALVLGGGLFAALNFGNGNRGGPPELAPAAGGGPVPPPVPPKTATPAPSNTPAPTIDILAAAAQTQTTQAQINADIVATALLLLDSTAQAATITAIASIPTDTPIPPTETLAPSATTAPTNTAGPTSTTGPSATPAPTRTPRPSPTVDPNPPTATPLPTETVPPTPTAPTGAVLSMGNGSLFSATVDIGSVPAGSQGGSCVQGRVFANDGGRFSRFGVQVDNRGNTRQASTDPNGGTYSICGLGAGEWGISVFNAGGVDIPPSEQVAHQVRVLLTGTPGEVFFVTFRATAAFNPPTPTPTPLVGPYDGQWGGTISGKTAGDVDFTGNFRMEVRANAIYRISIDGPSCLFETYPNFPNGAPLSGNSFSLAGSPFNPQLGTDGSINFSINGSFASSSQASGLLNASQNGGSCAIATWNASRR